MNGEAVRQEIFGSLSRPDRSGRPKYQRCADALVEAIRRGVWRPGDRLPAEDELAGLTPFSLGTVQRALRDLSEQGLVVRQHGLGSFVADPPRELHDPWHCRFLADDGRTILPIYSQAVQRIMISEPGPWTDFLGADAKVMRLDRIVIVNDEFRISSRFYADRALLKKLYDMPMERLNGANFKRLIVNQCQLPITHITHHAKVKVFDDEACAQIGVESGYRGLFMFAFARAGRDRPVYYQEFFVGPTDRAMQFPEGATGAL
ncbi:MAG TPA: GntR family transcriptional regulator [Ramlibacter sp.]|uniref:GntR family transcriptional regulator n=1 Tax=Ramlibacter sp. TaxID=1917967 RepID=UPI002D029130|nr:GntR family transcriptional regulator [Ramlibacter sp.]HVZ46895.1 GntR family transcriptional regulator [Ramlibacter sp.]